MDDPRFDRADFVIRYNTMQVAEPCAVCDEVVDQPTGPALLTIDAAQVCTRCGERLAPELVDMLTAWWTAQE